MNIFDELIELKKKRDNKIVANILLAKLGLREDVWIDFERQRGRCARELARIKSGGAIEGLRVYKSSARALKLDLEVAAYDLADCARNLRRESLRDLDDCLRKICVNMGETAGRLESLRIDWREFVCEFCGYYIDYLARRLERESDYARDYLDLADIYEKLVKIIDKLGEIGI